jgi:hypothetical protein
MTTRKCTQCQEVKELQTGFHINRRMPGGRAVICKQCKNTNERERYALNPEAYIQRSKQWKQANAEWVVEYYAERWKRIKAERNKQQT